MTRLVWDQVDDRLYKAGIDHGVLYLPNDQGEYDDGVAWNGLTSIDESFGDDTTSPYYYDGVKYLDSYDIGDFQAKLSAFTYPDEFLEFEGMEALGNGLYVDDQPGKLFGLTYRTLIGSMQAGLAEGYRIHLVYNLTAVPGTLTFQNGSNPSEPLNFDWDIYSIPEKASPYRPTGHIILDSRLMNDDVLASLEDIIYGTEGTKPRLPSLEDLLDFVYYWGPKFIMHKPLTGLSPLVPGSGDLTPAKVDGIYSALPTTRLVETALDGLYILNQA